MSARKIDVQKALEMISQGQKLIVIADHFGATHAGVQIALKRAGLPTCSRKYLEAKRKGTLPLP